jgi:NAD(P)-dependent dehydrogenase (short-subunit alcohol dehydrogenase family)
MLKDTTAFVTGASQGIGREIAITLANHGANVTLAARSDGIYETAKLIGDESATLSVETDVTDEDSVEAAIEATVEEFGGLDCLVNNAGIAGPTKPIQEITLEEWQRVQDVNVTGTFLCTKHAVRHLVESDRASIVSISSRSAKTPHPNRTPYTASNAGQLTMMRAVAYELGEHSITANTICPGPVDGDRIRRVLKAQAQEAGRDLETFWEEYESQIPLNEFVPPEEIGEMVAYLAGPNARHITAQSINIDSGLSVY